MTTNEEQPYLRIERRFEVLPDTVFDTLTDPGQMRIWWGEDTEFKIDLRVGGQWTITRWEGGEKYFAAGETSHSEAGWQQGFDLMAAAWSESA